MMKKAISVLLALILLLGLCIRALAVSACISADKTALYVGETIRITLSLSQKLENITNFEYSIYYDPGVFELLRAENGTACSQTQISKSKTDKQGKTFYSVSFVDTSSEGVTVNAGTVYTLVFKAVKASAGDVLSNFELGQVSVMDTSWEQVPGTTVSMDKLTIRILCMGDVNSDGDVDLQDVSLLFRWWNGKAKQKWEEKIADINTDGKADLTDAAALFGMLQKK